VTATLVLYYAQLVLKASSAKVMWQRLLNLTAQNAQQGSTILKVVLLLVHHAPQDMLRSWEMDVHSAPAVQQAISKIKQANKVAPPVLMESSAMA